MRRPIKRKHTLTGRYIFCAAVSLLLAAVFIARLFQWQIVDGAAALQDAEKSSQTSVTMSTNRGEIVDKNGVGLATNKTGYSLQFDHAYMTSSSENSTILRLINLLEKRGEKWLDTLPIVMDASGNYSFKANSESEIKYLKSKDFLDVNTYANAQTCMQNLISKYFKSTTSSSSPTAGYSKADLRKVVSVRYAMTLQGFDYSLNTPYTFAEDISRETVEIVSENSDSLPGVVSKVTTTRQNPNSSLIPQVVGTMGAISEKQYSKLKSKGYHLDDRLGTSGIESAMESTLRGTEGKKNLVVDSKGKVTGSTVLTAPVNGNTVFLTIDANLQKVAAQALATNVQAAHSAQSMCKGGGVVVLNVKDFSVLAAASYPTYDLSKYPSDTAYTEKLLSDSSNPLIDRSFGSAYTPGSIFKPAVALAALQEGIINSNTTFVCNHRYLRFESSGYTPTCEGNHGAITVEDALAKSCNIFFFETGYHTKIANMNVYCKKLGLGEKTGVEIAESTGTLAGPGEKKASGGTWYETDTIQAAIGQSDNAFTPAQLASYVATIANNGTRKQEHLVDHVTDYSRKKVISTVTPETYTDNSSYSFLSKENLDIVKAGMRKVCTSGTASGTFASYPIAVAAKTGTAETSRASNTTFITFAPYDNPQIAIAVVIEHGEKGKYSQNVAKAIYDAYFKVNQSSSSSSASQ
ncbi:MAG: penicillin-binding protein [Oscillospiraceae bacterium]|jgi:penicillin-binding protein 2|nr:penicillin-binding protein [Oscillospiraceae bacterium]MDD3260567.1 penicillin-binding transpeptidase domain-containing protein [Oscillospiraceae bacterium]